MRTRTCLCTFFRVCLEESGEERNDRREKRRLEEYRRCEVESSQNSAVEEDVSSENRSVKD